jgi:hypothetical protein
MEGAQGLGYWTAVMLLDRMNSALHRFQRAEDEDARQEADVRFADHYDALVEHGVPIRYDPGLGLWMLNGTLP